MFGKKRGALTQSTQDRTPVFFADMHNHALFGVDDGAKTEQDMQAMLTASYRDGVRWLCLTPHCHPGLFGRNNAQVETAFAAASAFVKEHLPDMQLYLGSEFRYHEGMLNWLTEGLGRAMNGTRYLLVDFSSRVEGETLLSCVMRLLRGGYIPLLAHVERYERLHRDMRELRMAREEGAVLQLDTQSLLGGFGEDCRRRAQALLDRGYISLVGSDAHDTAMRPVEMSEAFYWLLDHYGRPCAVALMRDEPLRLLTGGTTT